jgi:hypothetical protein
MWVATTLMCHATHCHPDTLAVEHGSAINTISISQSAGGAQIAEACIRIKMRAIPREVLLQMMLPWHRALATIADA